MGVLLLRAGTNVASKQTEAPLMPDSESPSLEIRLCAQLDSWLPAPAAKARARSRHRSRVHALGKEVKRA